jgi:hypothetical protein
MNITRAWAMPNKNTFSILPIRKFIEREIPTTGMVVDPFVRNSPFKNMCVSNDLDTDISADFNMDALDFLKTFSSESIGLLLFDPPYSPRQVSECYKKMDMTVNMQTTQSSFWGNIKKEITRIVKPGGAVISCGWNSGGIGKTAGFKIADILLVAHGGWHNDTIVTMEIKQ